MQPDGSSDGLGKPEIALIFRLEAGFKVRRVFFAVPEEFLDARECPAGGCGASFDGFVGAIEIIPGERLHIRADNKVGVALPNFELMLLSGADCAAYDLEDIGWSTAVAVLDANGNADDSCGAEVARGERRHGGDQAAISEAAGTYFDRFEKTREGATRADGVDEIAVREDDWFTVSQVSSNHGHGDTQILKATRFEDTLDEVAKAVIAGEAEPRNAPASDIAKTKRAAGSDDAREGRATGIGGAKDAADAGPCDMRDGNVVLFQDLKNT